MSDQLTIKQGEDLFKEGDSAKEVYVIAKGDVLITKNVDGSTVEIAKLSTGDSLGEMSVLLETNRTCTATATSETVVLIRYDAKSFDHLLATHPHIASTIIKILSKRLKETTNELVLLKGGS